MPAKKPTSKRAPRKTAGRPATLPAEGERRAQRGYTSQYSEAAAAIYAELDRGLLRWIGLAHKSAGILDDLVLGYENRIVGHQFKMSRFPDRFTLGTFLLGADGLLEPAARAWKTLRSAYPGVPVVTTLVTNDFPSTNDSLGSDDGAHSAVFLAELEQHAGRTLDDWKSSRWQGFIEKIQVASGLSEEDFAQFWQSFRLLCGPAADFALLHKLSPDGAAQAQQIADLIPRLVADPRDKDTWTRSEFLQELGWRDPGTTLLSHVFPLGAYVQRNVATEKALRNAISSVSSGYVALVGPPGAGKSTLLQLALATEPGIRVVRYLAYVPGATQGVGRGEAESFLADICAELRNSGLSGVRFRNDSLAERRQQFGEMLRQAGIRYENDLIRTLIVVDGLDHIPREEHPLHSLLAELPLPASVPAGVLFVLGTQLLELSGIKPAVRDQASTEGRRIQVAPLLREDVRKIADAFELDASLSRERLYELSQGHPLVTRYLIVALRDANPEARQTLLEGALKFDGDIQTVYESAWRAIQDDVDAQLVLGYLARSEAPMPLELLCTRVPEAAIERALRATRFLLNVTDHGWTVFHNSFRLFVLEKPRMRFGRVDAEYPARIYRELAELAHVAPFDSPQRWLELRYRARAADHAEVIALAQPARFREQFADGRPVSELYADVQLAFAAARSTHDAILLARLLLIHDEIDRRAGAIKYAASLPEALLCIGDLDGAESLVEQFVAEGYVVVDNLIADGQFERAERLFEKLEPLSQLLEGKLENRAVQDNVAEFKKWAARVHHFRDADHINEAIEHLSTHGLGHALGDPEDTPARVQELLRYCVGRAIVQSSATADPAAVQRLYDVSSLHLPLLVVTSAFHAYEEGDSSEALVRFRHAMGLPDFGIVPERTRLRMAAFALRSGDESLALELFDPLTPPSYAGLDAPYDSDEPREIASDIVRYARLATRLKRSLGEPLLGNARVLQPLQTHASAIGVLLGRADDGAEKLAPGEVTRVAKAAMTYLMQAKARASDEFFPLHQLEVASPVLCRNLIAVAARCGESELKSVLVEIDRAASAVVPNPGATTYFRREIALAIYDSMGDRVHASSRLEQIRPTLLARTPSDQINELSDLAIAFARIGMLDRAREIIGEVRDQTLGYATAPKKDPLYAVWRDLLVRANEVDPKGRAERVSLLMRQVSGMSKTEGSAAAGRISFELVVEATRQSPESGLAAATELSRLDMIGWPNIVDNVLKGVARRRTDLINQCALVWCRLSLPYYLEPYYRYPDRVGDFIDVAIGNASPKELANLIDLFCDNIEVESRIEERYILLQRLQSAVMARGQNFQKLDRTVARWQSEAARERHSSTPTKFDDVLNLDELEVAFEREIAVGRLGYEAPMAFARLAPANTFERARALFERWDAVREDARARFVVIDMAIKAGAHDYARRILREYDAKAGPSAIWTRSFGGHSRDYFRALISLDGSPVRACAYEDFVDSLLAGRENPSILIAELEELIPVLSDVPDWPALWELFAEQITATREYDIGLPFVLPDEPASEEWALAELIHRAYEIAIPELRRQAQLAALDVLTSANGVSIFETLIGALLKGQGDCPLYAAELLLLDRGDVLKDRADELVGDAANSDDFAVVEIADSVLARWGIAKEETSAALPVFYSLDVNEATECATAESLADSASGAMLVERVRGWTDMFPEVLRLLECEEVSEWQIQLRCQMLIAGWGGLAKFGATGTASLQAELRRLEMAIGFDRPHIAVAARALRVVAGELCRAGLVADRNVPYLLHQMGYSIPAFPRDRPVVRPSHISRPKPPERYSKGADESEPWLDASELEASLSADSCDFILADVSTFEIRKVNDAVYGAERLRAPYLDIESDDGLDVWLEQLPTAYWVSRLMTKDGTPSPFIVSRLSVRFQRDNLSFRLILCPNWVRILGWRSADESYSRYVDSRGAPVAGTYWWRDGGPVNVFEDATWGEGVVVFLTPEGKTQLEAVSGPISVGTHVRRFVTPSTHVRAASSAAVHRYSSWT